MFVFIFLIYSNFKFTKPKGIFSPASCRTFLNQTIPNHCLILLLSYLFLLLSSTGFSLSPFIGIFSDSNPLSHLHYCFALPGNSIYSRAHLSYTKDFHLCLYLGPSSKLQPLQFQVHIRYLKPVTNQYFKWQMWVYL